MTKYYAPSELPPGTLRYFYEPREGLAHVAKYYDRTTFLYMTQPITAEWREVCTNRLSPFASNRKQPDSAEVPTCLFCIAYALEGRVTGYGEERPWRRLL